MQIIAIQMDSGISHGESLQISFSKDNMIKGQEYQEEETSNAFWWFGTRSLQKGALFLYG